MIAAGAWLPWIEAGVGTLVVLVIGLVMRPRRKSPLITSALAGGTPGGAPSPLATHPLLRLAEALFGRASWLVRWAPVRFTDPAWRVWAGVEQETISTLLGFHLVAAGIGMLILGVLLFLLQLLVEGSVNPGTQIVGTLVAGGVIGLVWPTSFLQRRIRERDQAMAWQLIEWVRAIQVQLQSNVSPQLAFQKATEVLEQTYPAQLPPRLTDLYVETRRVVARVRVGVSLSDAWLEMAERCHQPTVKATILALHYGELYGTRLAETLEGHEAVVQEEIYTYLESLIEQRERWGQLLNVLAAFIVVFGTFGGMVVALFIQGFSQLP